MEPRQILENVLCAAGYILLVGGYHLWLTYVVKRYPSKTVFGITNEARKIWVYAIMKKKQDILAVQSLRNFIMASSLLATSSIFIIFGFVAFFGTIGSRRDTTNPENPLSSNFSFVEDQLFGIKVVLIICIYFFAFFCFAQAIRFYNHVGLVINTSMRDELISECDSEHKKKAYKLMNPATVADLLNRGSRFQTIGLRACFASFPLIIYIWGPYFLLGGALILVFLLRALDLNVTSLEGEEGDSGSDATISSGETHLRSA
ncbi:hypothetical protein HDU97_009802 [Phlyctochytrium planicorne]|nr:hypothetical protein HDU97_009802 [Phlyctochytrium planicorne]